MDIVYKWNITGIDGTPVTPEGLENVALAIHWQCTGCLEDYSSICNNRHGTVVLDYPDISNFISYDDVTEELAFSWLFSKLNKTEIENDIKEALGYADKLLAIQAKTPLGMKWSSTSPVITPDAP